MTEPIQSTAVAPEPQIGVPQAYDPNQGLPGMAAPALDIPEEPDFDYWGFEGEDVSFQLRGDQYFIIKRMTEGKKAKYQKLTTGSIKVQKNSGDAIMSVDPARDRHALITICVDNWYIKRQGKPVPFSVQELERFLTVADPQVIEDLEKAIRKLNPWLKNQMTSKEVKAEIVNLNAQLLEIEEQEDRDSRTSSR